MHSEARRPAEINLDQFVDRLDARLRDELAATRRVTLPTTINRSLRAFRIRVLAFIQGGAMAVTALAVMVAVGVAPTIRSADVAVSESPLSSPVVKVDSYLAEKLGASVLASSEIDTVHLEVRGITP
jgi:hypothetical protein